MKTHIYRHLVVVHFFLLKNIQIGTYMTWRDVLPAKQIQKDSSKAICNTFRCHSSYNTKFTTLRSIFASRYFNYKQQKRCKNYKFASYVDCNNLQKRNKLIYHFLDIQVVYMLDLYYNFYHPYCSSSNRNMRDEDHHPTIFIQQKLVKHRLKITTRQQIS